MGFFVLWEEWEGFVACFKKVWRLVLLLCVPCWAWADHKKNCDDGGLVPRFSHSEGSHLRWYDFPKEGSHVVKNFRKV
jgi:hypothetical protein